MKLSRRFFALLSLSLLFASGLMAQDRIRTVYPPLPSNARVRPTQPSDPTYIPAGSKVFVENIDGLPGFDNNLVAAFQKKQVNLSTAEHLAKNLRQKMERDEKRLRK